MKYNFNKVVTHLATGDILTDEKGNDLTYSTVIINSLLAQQANETLSGSQKFEYWKLAGRIKDAAEEVEITTDEIKIIKDKANLAYNTLVFGPLYKLLEEDYVG